MPRPLRLLLLLLAVPALHAQPLLHALVSPTPRSPGHFGGSVAGIGDLDGDGRGDLVVGAEWEAGLAGRVHVFSGATGALVRTLVSPAPQADGVFGIALDAVPDLDGDGVPDLAVTATSEGNSTTGRGRLHLFSGATGALLRTVLSPNPETSGAFPSFGCSVSGVADMDGDARGDLLVGACREGTSDPGRAYLLSGATGALLRTFSSPNPETNGLFGHRTVPVPDADGDGVADVMIAALTEDATGTNDGRVYLFSGATGALLRTLVSPTPGGVFGRSAAGVPDVDGDGRGDLLIGGTTTAGRAYVVSGATGALVRTLASPAPAAGDGFGTSVGVVPDLDGDGVADHIVGAATSAGSGRAFVFSGASGALLHSIASPNAKPSGMFGISVAGVPDADGDGRGDLLVGALTEDGPGNATGRAYLFSGAAAVSTEPPPSSALHTLAVAPNPLAAAGEVRLTLDAARAVRLDLHDVLGRRVAVLHDGPLPAGAHAFALGADGLPAGVYAVRATGADGAVVRRLTVLR